MMHKKSILRCLLPSLAVIACSFIACAPDKIEVIADPPRTVPVNTRPMNTATRDTGIVAQNIVWRDNTQGQSFVYRIHENFPLAAFYCTRIVQVHSPLTAQMPELGYVAAIFGTSRAKAVRISAGGSVYANVALIGERGDFVSIPMLTMSNLDTKIPLTFHVSGYAPIDSTIAWMERVQITSPLPPQRTDTLRGEFSHSPNRPLLITWDKAMPSADSGEVVIRGAELPPIRKPISPSATQFEISTDAWKDFDARGHHFSVTVRFYRAKSYENNTTVFVSSTESVVFGVLKQ